MGYDNYYKQVTPKDRVIAFVYTCVWGLLSLVAWFYMQQFLIHLFGVLWPTLFGTVFRQYAIAILTGIAWLIGVIYFWHKVEHSYSWKTMLLRMLRYAAIPGGILVMSIAGRLLLYTFAP